MNHPEPHSPFTRLPGVNGTLGVVLIVLSMWPWTNTNEGDLFIFLGAGLTATGLYFLAAGAVARGVLAARSSSCP